MPAGEFGCAKSSPVGRTATSKRALEMSTPTNTASPPLAAVDHPPAPLYLADPSSGSINHSGSTGGTSTATHALPRSSRTKKQSIYRAGFHLEYTREIWLGTPCPHLSRRPLHLPAPEEMEVEMGHRLTAVGAGVGQEPEPAFGDPLLPRDR